jgi:hypothetical protein
MVCFTDLLLSETKAFREEFGCFAVAFNKARFIEYGANPVFYATPLQYGRISHQLRLLEKMVDWEKDREWKEQSHPYQFTEDETLSLQIVSAFLQECYYGIYFTRNPSTKKSRHR